MAVILRWANILILFTNALEACTKGESATYITPPYVTRILLQSTFATINFGNNQLLLQSTFALLQPAERHVTFASAVVLIFQFLQL